MTELSGEDLIRETWRRWNEGVRELDLEVADPAIEIHSALADRVFSGEEGLAEWMAEIDEQFDAWQIAIDSVEQAEPGRFLVDGKIRARGRGSGMTLDQPASWVVDVEGSRVRRIKNFIGVDAGDRARAAAR